MTIEERIANLEKELAELKEEIEFKEDGLFKPNINERYFCCTSYGIVDCRTWNNNATDNSRYAVGNVFRTEEEAEFEAERLKVVAELRKFAVPNNVSFKEKQFFSIVFDSCSPKIITAAFNFYQITDLFFESEKIAEKAIKKVGEDRIIKYYFRVDTEAGKEDEHD